MGPQPAGGDVEHRAGKIDALVANRGQGAQQVGREIARTDPQLDDAAGGRNPGPQLGQHQVEQGETVGGRLEALGPVRHVRRVVELVVRADGRRHGRPPPPGSAPASAAVEISRMRYFWTLPVTVIGNPSTILQYRGIL